MPRVPTVSIIIVNYNGRQILGECLQSVFAITFPKQSFEVILVDNNSADDSVAFVARNFPAVKIIRCDQNLGFAGGNSLGYKAAIGKYIVLLNSDTKVDKHWLDELVKAAQPSSVGAVNSKLYFWMPFLELTIKSSVIERSEITGGTNFSPLGVLLEDVICDQTNLNNLIWYGSGFYEKIQGEITLRWTRDQAKILLPFAEGQGNNVYKLTAHGYPVDKPVKADFAVSIGTQEILKDSILSHQVKEYMINISPKVAKHHYIWLVQNAGNIVLSDGSGKDRGCVVLKRKGESLEFYEKDSEWFNHPTKLIAFCGASCLIKRSVIESVGFLDEKYFMYYEDLDLSLRIWTAGWDIVYAPSSLVYHRHRATTKNQQPDAMLYHLEKNYMAFLGTFFPFKTIAIQGLRILVRFIYTYFTMTIYSFSDNLVLYEEWMIKYQKRKAALLYVLGNWRNLIQKRQAINKRSKRSFNKEGRSFQY